MVIKSAILLLLLCGAAETASLRFWVQPCTNPESACRSGDPELAQWALEAWRAASDGKLTLEKATDVQKAHIRLYWATTGQRKFGEARPILVNGVRAEVYVRSGILSPNETDTLLRDAIVYLTCLHETGHALGLPHTAAFADIMYNFQYGGDIPEYFGRYRRLLTTRADIQKHSGMSADDRKRLVELFR
jgi:hypothetical protein